MQGPGAAANAFLIAARLVGKSTLRYTPAGIPVAELQLEHRSTVLEAGLERRIELPFAVHVVGPVAVQLDTEPLGQLVELQGFLAPKSRRSPRLVLHVTAYAALSEAREGHAGAPHRDENGCGGGAAEGQS